MSFATTVPISTQAAEELTSLTFRPGGVNETSLSAPDIKSTPEASTTFVPTFASTDRSPRPSPSLHPALFVLPPVVVVVALGVCVTFGLKNVRQRRQRRPKQARGQCVNANYGYQQRSSSSFDNGTTQRTAQRESAGSDQPEPEDPHVQATPSSLYNMASVFSFATTYGAAAAATYSPSTQIRTTYQTYTNEEVFCGTPTVDARPMSFFADSSAYGRADLADSSAYGRADQAYSSAYGRADQALSEDSLRHDSGSVSPLYKTAGAVINDTFGLKEFPWESLPNLPSLEELDLSFNSLANVGTAGMLSSLRHLQNLNLKYNNLRRLPEASLRTRHTVTVMLTNNPVHCDCELTWLVKYPTCGQNYDSYCEVTGCNACAGQTKSLSDVVCEATGSKGRVGLQDLLQLCNSQNSSMFGGASTEFPSTQSIDNLARQTTLSPGGHDEASDKAPNVTTFTRSYTFIDRFKRPHQHLHPALFVLPPVALTVAIGIFATIGIRISRRRQPRPKLRRDQCMRQRYRNREDRNLDHVVNVTMQSTAQFTLTMRGWPPTDTAHVQAFSSRSSCYNIASSFSSATRCGLVAGAVNSANNSRTAQQRYIDTAADVAMSTRITQPVDHTLSEASLCQSTIDMTVSSLYRASDDAVNFVYDDINRSGEQRSEQDQSAMYHPMGEVCHQGTEEGDDNELYLS
uniref:LRRCT domain-containing protein n=1 Tax=Branchiostoma floridae TaxID=7739 RepID=C3ZYW8_BRAFL|eukprot:XP_002586228.1 hypothetical protein BRAFLDRAFT_109415 [Branchiostoma floridae]